MLIVIKYSVIQMQSSDFDVEELAIMYVGLPCARIRHGAWRPGQRVVFPRSAPKSWPASPSGGYTAVLAAESARPILRPALLGCQRYLIAM